MNQEVAVPNKLLEVYDKELKSLKTSLNSLNTTLVVIILGLSLIIIGMIYYIYKNNKKLKDMDVIANNLGDLTDVSKDNDDYILKMNSKIVEYLKSREHISGEIDNLKHKLRQNKRTDNTHSEKITTLEEKVLTNSEELNTLNNLYKSQLELLSTLGLDEIYRISKQNENIEDVNHFREILDNTVMLFIGNFSNYVDGDINTFVNKYKEELSFIFAKVIYDYEIYNTYDEIPNLLLYKDDMKTTMKNSSFVDFLMKTYFSRMFEFIDSNNISNLTIDSINAYIFTNTNTNIVDTLKSNKMTELFTMIIPNLFIKSKTLADQKLPYMTDVNKLFLNSLNNCDDVLGFYNLWSTFTSDPKNVKGQTLHKLLENNKLFKTIFLDKIKQYNKQVLKNECRISAIPESN